MTAALHSFKLLKFRFFFNFHGLLRIPVALIYLMVKTVIFVWSMRFPNKMTSFRVFLCPRFHFSSVGLIFEKLVYHVNIKTLLPSPFSLFSGLFLAVHRVQSLISYRLKYRLIVYTLSKYLWYSSMKYFGCWQNSDGWMFV